MSPVNHRGLHQGYSNGDKDDDGDDDNDDDDNDDEYTGGWCVMKVWVGSLF